jgi:hypothetical protein
VLRCGWLELPYRIRGSGKRYPAQAAILLLEPCRLLPQQRILLRQSSRKVSRRSLEHTLPTEQDNVQRLYRDTSTALQHMIWETMVAKTETIAAKDEIISSKMETLVAKRQKSLAKDEGCRALYAGSRRRVRADAGGGRRRA